jgi:hypothetical protein
MLKKHNIPKIKNGRPSTYQPIIRGMKAGDSWKGETNNQAKAFRKAAIDMGRKAKKRELTVFIVK